MTYADVTGPRKSPHSRSQRFEALADLPTHISGEETPSSSHRHSCVSPPPCNKGLGAHGGKVTGWKPALKLTSWLDLEIVTQSP